jgi:hypothetical protein
MGRRITFLIGFLSAGSVFAASVPELPSQAEVSGQSELAERNAALLKQHTEIWDLMGLSPGAKQELNGLVLSINRGIYKNKTERPEAFEKALKPRRSDEPLTYARFVDGHKRRFSLLKISEPTQTELLAALDLTWRALHNPQVPEEQREVAETIRDLMKSMGGPPPCCDDSIFEQAGMVHPRSPPEIPPD